MKKEVNEKYNYIKPKHYEIFTVEDLKKLVE